MAESLLVDGAILLAGIVLLYLGAELLVSAASALALTHGLRAATVGVTVVGSNIYNVLAVIGIVALLVRITVDATTMQYELPVMLGFTFVALLVMGVGDRVTRFEGVGLIAGYGGFLYFLLP
jgi:cation:H+ antiporter